MPSDGRDYTEFYHDDIERALDSILAIELPSHTETSPKDPLNAFKRLEAFEGHRRSGMVDHVASELGVPTFDRRSSAIALARPSGYVLAADSPAVADIFADVAGTPGAADVLVPNLARFNSQADSETESVTFEHQDADVVVGNMVFSLVPEDNAVFGAVTTGTIVAPWAAVAVNDAIYFGHEVLQFDRVEITKGTPGTNYTTRYEYYDGEFKTVAPTNPVPNIPAGTIDFEVNSLVGTAQCDALIVRVRCIATDASELVAIVWGGAVNEITTATLLGQSTPSSQAGDYEVSGLWLPINTARVTVPVASNEQTWTLPAEAASDQKWQQVSVGGLTAYWMRERVTEVAVPTVPANVAAVVPTDTTWTVRMEDTLQGETVDDVIGTTTGTNFESMRLNHTPYVEGSISVLDIGGDTDWELVDSLLDSDTDDKVYILEEDTEGFWHVITGDGITGARPSAGLLVTATYRIRADDDGNVGAGTVNQVGAGVAFLTNIRNPHAATGWTARDGADEDGIERVRRAISSAARTRTRAVTSEDCEYLAVNEFATADGRSPFKRAVAVEQGAGFKSVRLVVIGSGGSIPTAADVAELETWFNGERVGLQRYGGKCMMNQEVIVSAYTPLATVFTVSIDVIARYAHLAQNKALEALRTGYEPLALTTEKVDRWSPGMDLTDGQAKTIIGLADIPGLVDVTFTAPAFPITLGMTELPQFTLVGTTITVVSI